MDAQRWLFAAALAAAIWSTGFAGASDAKPGSAGDEAATAEAGPTADAAGETADAADPAEQTVRTLMKEVARFHAPPEDGSLSAAEQAENRAAAERVNALIDVRGLAQRSLMGTWDRLSAAQRTDFVQLLERIFAEVAYPESSEFFRDLEIEYGGVERQDGKVTVQTTVSHPDEGLVGIDYVLSQVDGAWRIQDVILDDVSLAIDVRSQMQEILAEDGYDELLRRMREKLEEGADADLTT